VTRFNGKTFWTSGSDEGCPFKFRWCSTGAWFSNTSVNWLPGQPNNAYGVQDCVQITLNTGTWGQSFYNDDPCTFTYPYICEV
jgi:Lectin C-type domain